MSLVTTFACVMIFWSSLYLLHARLRSSSRFAFPYYSCMDSVGLSLHVGQIRWYTTRLNRFFIRLAQCRSRLWNAWFGLGAICGIVLSFVSMVVLASVLYEGVGKWISFSLDAVNKPSRHVSDTSSALTPSVLSLEERPPPAPPPPSSPKSQQLMTPVIPLVNLPSDQLGYYLLTLLVCAVLHEIGHAVAANCNHIRVNGFGLFFFLFMPGAFVDLNADSLQTARPWQQLKVYCAGVWHNVVIVVAAVAYLRFSASALFPFYATGDGAVVSYVFPGSVISGPRGLQIGDVITKVSNCPIRSADDWRRCLLNQSQSAAHEIPGYCVPVGYIMQHHQMSKASVKRLTNVNASHSLSMDNSEEIFHACCGANHTAKDLCFSFHSKELSSSQAACLHARSVSERRACRVNADCVAGRRVKGDITKSICAYPWVGNRTRLLRIVRPPASAILFLGNPLELRLTVRVSDYRRRFSFLPVSGPAVIELWCKYLASLSGALALFNVVPCYHLDGQFILSSLVEILLPPSRFSRTWRDVAYYGCRFMGTTLLVLNVLLAFSNIK